MEALRQIPYASWMQYWGRRLGWHLVIGMLLLSISFIIVMAWAVPTAHKVAELAGEAKALRTAIPQHQGKWIDRSPQAALNVFYEALPEERAINAHLADILASASMHGLVIEKADYALLRSSQAAFSRYQLLLPMHGNYVDIRRFIDDVLKAHPTAALNEVSFKRQDTGATVEARLRFTLYVRKAPA